MPVESKIIMRANPHVTAQENKINKFSQDHFHPHQLFLQSNSAVVNSDGKVLAMVLKNIVLEHLIRKAEEVGLKHMQAAAKHSTIEDKRGRHISAVFGSYIEQGGSGSTWNRRGYEWCPNFLEEINKLRVFVSHVFHWFFEEIASNMDLVPSKVKLWETISLLFWNGTSISKKHIDTRDLEISVVVPFGKYCKSWVDLYYLNILLGVERGDLYFINSNKVYHTVQDPEPKRQSFVFTNHNCVVKRYCRNVDISNLFSKINKNE